MRIKETKVYTFDELTDSAKEKARDWYRSIDTEIAWAAENQKSMEEFAKLFPIKVTDWSYGGRGEGVYFRIEDENVEGLKGLRLLTWLENKVFPSLEKGKYFFTSGMYTGGKYTYKSRHSNAIKEISCPLTGYCMDHELIDPLLAFRKSPDANTDLKELLNDCFNSWVRACDAEIEYQDSDENVDETIRINEYEFTEEGKRS